jgi:hypothetical protein
MTLTQLGTTIAAIIAALLTMFGIVVVRGTKISEMRQKWIDDQRSDLAALLSNAAQLSAEPTTKRDERLLAFDTAANRIRLRENPLKPEWTRTIEQITRMRTKLSVTPPRSCDISDESNEVVDSSRLALKAEWKRIVRGELGYRIFSRTALIVTLLFAAVASGLVLAPIVGYKIPIVLTQAPS